MNIDEERRMKSLTHSAKKKRLAIWLLKNANVLNREDRVKTSMYKERLTYKGTTKLANAKDGRQLQGMQETANSAPYKCILNQVILRETKKI